MTDKIKKLLSKALNNSSASEAAQALKTAASTMHGEGINPNRFLTTKAAAGEREAQEAENAELRRALAEERRKIAQLESALKTAAGNPAALREAKEQAIHWHRTSQEHGQKVGALRGWIKKLVVMSVVACIGAYVAGSAVAHRGAEALRLQIREKDKQIDMLNARLPTTATGKPAKRKEIYNLKAACSNGQGKKINPAWTINTRKLEVEETTTLLDNGYSLSLADKAIPTNGQRFKLTWPDGRVMNCTVVDAR